MIHTNQLKFIYPKGAEISFENFTLEAGNEMLIIGPSGCGKTTLLHLIGGLLQPATGDIIINNKNIAKFKGKEMDSFRGRHIGIIFQKPHFARALTVGENLHFAQKIGGNTVDKERVKELLNRLGIIKHINKSPQHMSEGEKQRLSVAMALINKPSLLLADEPTASLDDKHATEVIKLLRELSSEENTALIIVTHDSRLKNEFKENILTLKSLQ
ncbi:ABC transporter ATP-binding protein [Flammeovirga kamogawensis]|uniref:ATP-binding cassette domain-containing protein n=1 Tax=Flammeovirga kamogawensis TaxID=373891 RepID=A0ABX8GRT2_9BACT|nr:ATP-binding cassette domain-containing protein [Flammeovirga kamogawensis]MBB6462153.1 putative ABC transport system ATP-binding protein [Flammeovirga kamogawensis]QWG05887.1 ATP-binding cassette domain-containing protein [Flammeovirga kamogawensis]TRX67711.1 ATP-binding cassette domain-containing protein [Flammeovirga kamogawensis]